MFMFKKYWWFVCALIAVVIASYFIFKGEKVEYAELNNNPHVIGNLEASVSLLEYSDFQCSACAAAYVAVKKIIEKYGDKLKFEFRHFPLSSIHNYAYKAASASECASDQEKFWEYYDKLFLNQDKLASRDLENYASGVEGMDQELFRDCLLSGAKDKRVDEDILDAQSQNLNATPTFFLNGQKIADWGMLDELIQNLLQPFPPLAK